MHFSDKEYGDFLKRADRTLKRSEKMGYLPRNPLATAGVEVTRVPETPLGIDNKIDVLLGEVEVSQTRASEVLATLD